MEIIKIKTKKTSLYSFWDEILEEDSRVQFQEMFLRYLSRKVFGNLKMTGFCFNIGTDSCVCPDMSTFYSPA